MEKREYRETILEKLSLKPEQILSHEYDDLIKERLSKVVLTEWPIIDHLLFKRVLNSLGLEKLGSRLEPYFISLADSANIIYKTEMDMKVYYPDCKSRCDFFRPCDDVLRYSYQIPPIEGVNCIVYILKQSMKSLYKTELLNLFAKEFGYERKGNQVIKFFESSRVMAKSRNAIKESGNHKIML